MAVGKLPGPGLRKMQNPADISTGVKGPGFREPVPPPPVDCANRVSVPAHSINIGQLRPRRKYFPTSTSPIF